MARQTIEPFTVVLRYPDYLQCQDDDSYYIGSVGAHNAVDAVDCIRKEVTNANDEAGGSVDPEDFAVVAVFAGQCDVVAMGYDL